MRVNRQDSNIIVKSIDQSPKSCESMVQSTVQSGGPGIVETLPMALAYYDDAFSMPHPYLIT